jgi:hypothetical protein
MTRGTLQDLTDTELGQELYKNRVMKTDIEMIQQHKRADEAMRRGYVRIKAIRGELLRIN